MRNRARLDRGGEHQLRSDALLLGGNGGQVRDIGQHVLFHQVDRTRKLCDIVDAADIPAELLALHVLFGKAAGFIIDPADRSDELTAQINIRYDRREDHQQDRGKSDGHEIRPSAVGQRFHRSLDAEDRHGIARGILHGDKSRDVRQSAAEICSTVDGAVLRLALIQLAIDLRVFFICCFALVADLPRRVRRAFSDGVEDRDKAPVIGRIDLDHIDQGDVHLLTIAVEILRRLTVAVAVAAVLQIGVELVAVDQRGRGIRHVIGRLGVFGFKRLGKTDIADRRYDQAENQQKRHRKHDDIHRKTRADFIDRFHSVTKELFPDQNVRVSKCAVERLIRLLHASINSLPEGVSASPIRITRRRTRSRPITEAFSLTDSITASSEVSR